MKKFLCLLLILLSLMGCKTLASKIEQPIPDQPIEPATEPYWADLVKDWYPGWERHYWTDRDLWGNQGYIVGGPPQLPDEKVSLRSRGRERGIGDLELRTVYIHEPGRSDMDSLEAMDFLPLKSKASKHVVVKGDTLWDISATYYGNPLMWPRIYQANRDRIKDPDWIYPGQVFLIPPAP